MEAPGGITDSIDLMTKTNITGMWKHDIENFDDDRIVDNLDALRLSIRSFPRLLDVNIGSGEEVAIATEMVDSTSDSSSSLPQRVGVKDVESDLSSMKQRRCSEDRRPDHQSKEKQRHS